MGRRVRVAECGYQAVVKLLQSHGALSLRPPFLLNLLPTHLLLLTFSLTLLRCGKWEAVENGRSNDALHVVEFANLSDV